MNGGVRQIRVWLCEESTEAARLGEALGKRGISLRQVALEELPNALSHERPDAVVVDGDDPLTARVLERIQESSASPPEFYVVGLPTRLRNFDAPAFREGNTHLLPRPLQLEQLARALAQLGQPPSGPASLDTPRSGAPSTRDSAFLEARPAVVDMLDAGLGASYSLAPAAAAEGPDDGMPLVPAAELSPEVEYLLAHAERRSLETADDDSPSMSQPPEPDFQAVLPRDVLDALDAPLEGFDEEGSVAPGTAGGWQLRQGDVPGWSDEPPPPNASPAPSLSGKTTADSAPPDQEHRQVRPTTAPPAASAPARPGPSSEPVTPPPKLSGPPTSGLGELGPVAGPPTARRTSSLERPEAVPTPSPGLSLDVADPPFTPEDVTPAEPAARPVSAPPSASQTAEGAPSSVAEPTLPAPWKAEMPGKLASGLGLRALGMLVRHRHTGAVAFQVPEGLRRVLLRDGDFVIASAGSGEESLAAFLVARGDLRADAMASLGRRVPTYGRHAGAALVANGHLRQDDLWPVLRGHSEWLLARTLVATTGTITLERETPARLAAEPSVFGGATGAEVLVHVARRTLTSATVLDLVGGENARFLPGPAPALLREAALSDPEHDLVEEAVTARAGDLLQHRSISDAVVLAYVLAELGVLELVRGLPTAAANPVSVPPSDPYDEAAQRSRILSRRALVEDGDYFALLGISRRATTYDVDRAYERLIRDLAPDRVLGGATADLKDDVDLILDVLAEAHEILSDEVRRERYLRALADP